MKHIKVFANNKPWISENAKEIMPLYLRCFDQRCVIEQVEWSSRQITHVPLVWDLLLPKALHQIEGTHGFSGLFRSERHLETGVKELGNGHSCPTT